MPWRTPPTHCPDPGAAQDATHRRPRQPQPFLLDQLVGEVLIVEALVLTQTQLRHPYPNLLRHSMGRCAPAVAVNYACLPQLGYSRPHPPQLPRRYPQHSRPLGVRH